MENNDRNRMYELGEWLSKCLNPKIMLSELDSVFQEGLVVLNIEDNLSCFLHIDPDGIFIRRFFGHRSITSENYNQEMIVLQHEIRKAVIKYRTQGYNSRNLDNFVNHLNELNKNHNLSLSDDFLEFITYLSLNNDLLKRLSKTKLSWQKEFHTLSNDNNNVLGSIIHQNVLSYTLIHETINKNDAYKLQNKLTEAFDDPASHDMAVFSHILFEFLRSGGQNHIIFCKHCGRFTFAKRLKPSGIPAKEFCSNKCRTANKRI